MPGFAVGPAGGGGGFNVGGGATGGFAVGSVSGGFTPGAVPVPAPVSSDSGGGGGSGPVAGLELGRLLEQVIESSGGLCEYEDALHLLVSRQQVEAVDVTGLPWTEVDFVEDLRRAQVEVFPAIARLDGV